MHLFMTLRDNAPFAISRAAPFKKSPWKSTKPFRGDIE